MDEDSDVRARIMAKAQLKSAKLNVDSLRAVCLKDNMRISCVSPRFVKYPTDIYIIPHQRAADIRFDYVERKERPRFLKQLGTTDIIAGRKARLEDNLEIRERPRFLKELETTNVIAGRKAQLEVKVSGVPKPEVKWYKNWISLEDGDNIQIYQTDSDHYVLNIYDAQSVDSGLYTCKARNDSGCVNTSAMIHVDANYNVQNHKPHTKILCDPDENDWSDDLSDDLARIRRQLEKLREDFRQHEEVDLLHRKAVAKYRMSKRCD